MRCESAPTTSTRSLLARAAPRLFVPGHAVLGLAVLGLAAACEPLREDDDAVYAPPVLSPDCRPNNDGTITREELPFVLGAAARVRVTEGPVDVDVDGDEQDGEVVWDFSRPDPEREPVGVLQLQPMEGQWFQGSFPGSSLAGPLVPGGALLGPLVVDDAGVHLLGMASREPDPAEGQTLAVYDEGATLYPFPLSLGARAVSEVEALDAKLLGLPTAFLDRYDVEATQRGTLILPDLVLQNTLRVTVRFERTLLVGDARQVTHHYVHECLGEVARVVSPTKPLAEEIPDEFATAQQVWRLAL